MSNRRVVVRFPIYYSCTVHVIQSRDVVATGRRLGADLSNARAAFVSYPDQPKTGWIVLGPDVDEGTIAHEASHAIRALFACVGARTDNENFAYHLDYLVGRIHRFIKRKP
jgi:hypothetical protein